MSALFITATGTDMGKTYLTRALIRHFRSQERPLHAIKPVISGYEARRPESSDTFLLASALGLPWEGTTADTLSPWRFAAPLSPHLAAEKEGKTIDEEALLTFCAHQMRLHEFLLIEGAGGAMSPLTSTLLNADIIARLHIPALVVAGTYLGAIGHSLATVECLLSRGVAIKGLVVNAPHPGSDPSLSDTLASLRRFSPVDCPILPLPHAAGNDTLAGEVASIAELVS